MEQMESKDNKADLMNDYFKLFLDKKIPTEILLKFTCTTEHLPLQDFISSNLKKEFKWMTAISLMDSIDAIIDDSTGNRNLKFDARWKYIDGVFYLLSESKEEKLYNGNIVYEAIKDGKIREVESVDKNGNVYLKEANSIDRRYLRRILTKYIPNEQP